MGLKDWFTHKKQKNKEKEIKTEIEKEIKTIKTEVQQEIEKIVPESMAALRLVYGDFYENEPVQESVILYESYAGRGLVCSPYAIFKCFLGRPDFEKYTHIWVLENMDAQKDILESYKEYGNVKFVQRDTVEYVKTLCQAKFLITNLSFPNYYIKKPDQIYINTWHGIPLKTLGFDIPDGRITGLNTIRNFLSVDVFLSPNRFMTERFQHAFRLEGLYEGHIMESGMPRNDNLFHTKRQEIIGKLQQAGVEIQPDKKLIMYAPTWKGDKYSAPDTSTELYFELMNVIETNVDTEQYQVLVKPHQIVYKHIVDKGEKLTNKFIPASIDTNELLSIVDILISDYSSIYFDFLASGRPILFYIPDLQEYKTQRGLYFGIDKLPGPIAENFEQLASMIADVPAAIGSYKEKYEEEKHWACGNDDGTVCERVIDKIIVKRDFTNMISCDYQKKQKLLLYSGGLIAGKKRDKLDEFIQQFNYDKYDLTLIVPHTESEEVFDWIRNVDSRVRVLRRTGTHAANKEERICMELLSRHSKKDPWQEIIYNNYCPLNVYKREVCRIIGQTHFDFAIDYSQKSLYYTNLFQCMENTKILDLEELESFRVREQ